MWLHRLLPGHSPSMPATSSLSQSTCIDTIVDSDSHHNTTLDNFTPYRTYRNSSITDYMSPEFTKLNIAIGDDPSQKDSDHIRIYFQNINGIKTNQSWHKWSSGLQHANTLQTDIICLSETNVKWTTNTIHQCTTTIRKHHKVSKINTSHCNNLDTTTTYQPGGTATLVTGKWTNRILATIYDETGMGRWSGYVLRASNNNKIHIITAYCPNTDNKFGSSTNYQQLWRHMRSRETDPTIIPNPRKTMLKDLRQLIQKIHQNGDKVILAWDTNDTLNSSSLIEFMADTSLQSLMGPSPDDTTTYSRGKRIIDHIVGSTTLPNISKYGYFAFYDGAWHSDHRALFIDIPATSLFQSDSIEIHPIMTRKLVSTHAINVKRFINNIAKQNQYNAIYDTIKRLEQLANWTQQDHQQLEDQDVKFTALLLKAESKLPNHSNIPWSPEVHKAYQMVKYWTITISQRRNNIQSSNTHTYLETELGEDRYMNNIHRPPFIQLQLATKELQRARANATSLRRRFLTIMQEERVLADNRKEEKIIKNIIQAEQRQRSFKTIKQKLRPHQSTGGLSHIIITDTNGNLQRIDDNKDMEAKLHDRNRIHFSQAQGTPFTVPPLSTHLGSSGCTDNALNILRGASPPNDTHPAAKAILEACLQIRDPLCHHFPATDMLDGFKKWRENTTTSPSGKHLGIYKSMRLAYTHSIRATTETDDTEPSIAFKLVYIQNGLINLAIQQCHTYQRWQVVHNFFLEKIPGHPLVDKLRVIHIYEADWNLILKYFISRKLIQAATANKTTTSEQAGGRPQRSAIDEATKTVLLYETCRIQRRTGGIMYNDAKACFDRVIENISNLSCLREGLPIEIAKLHSQTFESIKYYIKHKNGIASIPNGHNKPDPFYGVGQGSGDAGARWGLVSDCIIRAYNLRSHNAIIVGPISSIMLNEKCQLFVDDSRLFALIVDQNGYTIKELLKNDTQQWERLLYASGGKLELTKCKYCIFSWTFNSDGTVTLDDQHNKDTIQLTSSETHQQLDVEPISINTSYKLLGVQIAFNADTSQQASAFKDKCIKFAKLFNQLNLPHIEVNAGYIGAVLPSFRYPFPATSIPVATMRKHQKPFISALLPKLGYNRKFPRSVVFAPKYFGGLGVLDFGTEQSIAHILTFIAHIRSQSQMTTNCIQLIESYQVLSGISDSPLQNTTPLPHIDTKIAPWLEVCRSFLQSINAVIITPLIKKQNTYRQFDQHIMDIAMQVHDKPSTLRTINQCRLFLQVATIAEISTSNGLYLLPQAIYGETDTENNLRLNILSSSNISWPPQQRPPASSWRVWKNFLTTLTKPTTSSTLQQPLGPWKSHSTHQRTWQFYTTKYPTIIAQQPFTNNPTFYRQDHNQLTRYNRIAQPETAELMAMLTEDNAITTPFTPVSISHDHITGHRDTIRGTNRQINSESSITINLPIAPSPLQDILTRTTNATIHIHCACYCIHNQAHFCWTIRTATQLIVQKIGTAPPSISVNNFRAEIIGIITALSYYQQQLTETSRDHSTAPSTIWWTTSKSIIKKVTNMYEPSPTQMLEPEREHISTIRNLLNALPHIKVRQIPTKSTSDHTTWHKSIITELTVQAQLESDEPQCPTTSTSASGNKATLYINTKEVSSDIQGELRNARLSPEYRDYLSSKHPHWTLTTWYNIDWNVHNNAFKLLTYTQQKTIRQYLHDWLPVNKHPGLSYVLSTICPQCNDQEETQSHFITCPCASSTQVWNEIIQNIISKSESIHLDPKLSILITQVISHRSPTFIPDTSHLGPAYRTLIEQQQQIGWHSIMKGRMSTKWATLQNLYDQNNKGHVKISKIITCIFQQILQAWQHRCNAQHGITQIDQDNKRKFQIKPKLQAILQLAQQLHPADKPFFDHPIEQIMSKPLRQLEDWLRLANTQLQQGLQRVKLHQQQRTQSILTFFHRRPRQQPGTHPPNPTRRSRPPRNRMSTSQPINPPRNRPLSRPRVDTNMTLTNPPIQAPLRTNPANFKDP